MAIDPRIANDEKVVAIATALKKDRYAVAGHFPVFLGEVARHAADGDLAGVSDATLDAWADGLRGFGALVRKHLCDPKGRLLSWAKYNGKALRALKKTRDRVARWRKAHAKEKRNAHRNVSRNVTETVQKPHGTLLTDTDTDTLTKLLKNKPPAHAEWDAEFSAAWDAYPKRPGNSRADALKAYRARRKEGVLAIDLLAGVGAYAAHCQREATEPRFVKQAATFFGPGRHWETDWGTPAEEKIWPYVNAHGIPDPDGEFPNPAFAKLLADTR